MGRAAARRSADRIAGRTSGRSPAVPAEFARANLSGDPSAPIFPALPVLEALKATTLPILHVAGDHDIIFPVENWYALNQSLPTDLVEDRLLPRQRIPRRKHRRPLPAEAAQVLEPAVQVPVMRQHDQDAAIGFQAKRGRGDGATLS